MMRLFGGNRNFGLLCIYYIFNTTAIIVSASGLVTDLFLLNTGIDAGKFGTLKSNTFLLPAVFFLLASGFLARLNKDRAIAAWCYIARCAVPALTTGAIVVFSPSPEVTCYMVAVMFVVSFTCAAFANNILTRILQQALPPENFNRGCIFIPELGKIFSAIAVLGQVWLLEKMMNDRNSFLLTLFLLQFSSALLEIPAYRAIMALQLKTEAREHIPVRFFDGTGLKKIFAEKNLRFVLFSMLLRGIYSGMLGAYLGIFLIKVCHWRPISIALIEIALAWIVIFTSGRVGGIANKLGIPGFLGTTIGICAVINLFWGIKVHETWLLWIFLIFIYNGVNGLLTESQGALESGSTTLFAPAGRHELSIGLGALARAVGAFSGSCIASWLFVLLPGEEEDKLQKFFILCAIIPFLLFLIYGFSYRTSICEKFSRKNNH